MKVLFVHQNYPGQYKHLAPALAARPGIDVSALHMRADLPDRRDGVRLHRVQPARGSTPGVHPWVADLETKTIRGEATFRAGIKLRQQGYAPDVIVGHPGWGEMLFLKDVWPTAAVGIYSEFYYRAQNGDVGFDPEFASNDPATVCRVRLKNLTFELSMARATAGLAPTQWQAETFPPALRDRIAVIHDGIDTDQVAPNPTVSMTLNRSLTLTPKDEVVTFVNRNLEPYRGYHIFMRALPALLRNRPKARVLIVGGDGVSYGARPPDGTWKARFIEEVRPGMRDADWARVHFLGNVSYTHFLGLLQLSTVHVYLTYPFVLSWSLLEAMSAGCAIVASDTAPLREAIRDDETGVLVDFFDVDGLADRVTHLLADAPRRRRLGQAARAFARATYDLKTVCLPRQIAWVEALARGEAGSALRSD
ncbi:glycosyltransferase family 4 protein [Roseospira goensis]|uniref:Glycosyltransferase involved in cell wall biosynthesis n=1 Tax=Roseospira goensis TaxID=391922 RepID=A0A7W6RZQ0_9PROT|nr:glycosyltransferase family 4 protein [Roseospira goensis]MBB4285552.1 glycosyltransferase involved in cell wall biosynthesis [Roseospira goensis]